MDFYVATSLGAATSIALTVTSFIKSYRDFWAGKDNFFSRAEIPMYNAGMPEGMKIQDESQFQEILRENRQSQLEDKANGSRQ